MADPGGAIVTDAGRSGPFPPGDYDVVVVGSGPGGLQTSYYLSRLGIDHAVISADPAPGGMFRRFPFFQRLLSWTKPHAQLAHDSREYERYDWNSLIAFEPEHRAVMPPLMDGSSEFPSRPEMEQGLRTFAERTGVRVRYGTRWEGTSTRRRALRPAHVRRRLPRQGRRSSRSAPPSRGCRRRPASSSPRTTPTRAPAETYAGKRLFIIGKQNSGLRARERAPPVGQPDRARLAASRRSCRSTSTRSTASAPATSSPGRTPSSAAGCSSSTPRSSVSSGRAGGITVHTRRSDTGEPFAVEVDEVIAATGLQQPAPGPARRSACAVFGRSGWPALTNDYESATVPDIWFAGTITQARRRAEEVRHPGQLRRRPRPPLQQPRCSSSRVVEAARPAASASGRRSTRRRSWTSCSTLRRPRPSCGTRSRTSLERSRATPTARVRDEGIVSLADFVDAAGPDGVAITVETDDDG